jgi:tetratricopeptide (TPR) repeat protein
MGEAEPQKLLEEGDHHLHAGRYEAAERVFRQMLDIAPDSAIARSKLGVALAQQGRLDDAIAEFSSALSLNPTYAPAYSNLGNAYREKGMLAEAMAAYERALAIDPEYWMAHQNLGILYKQMGRVGDAVEHFKKATRLSVRRSAGETRGVHRGCLPTSVLLLLAAVMLVAVLLWTVP